MTVHVQLYVQRTCMSVACVRQALNFNANLCPQKLEALLRRYGKVISTRILRDTDHESRGVGFARYTVI